ncbi:50S ribosomal protein L11 methyltransferase [Novosphingobium flavum]|uniref:50S ribosomal protein L11 methyltransferase n=1 Tax=Novosphingobium aerophilum TaxID=2839843 RepID=UPI00163A340D|nr:50S ribosomal protein L11 methyltransferase [Novosphingobium aerophilum]
MSWKITTFAPRPVIEAALIAHEDVFDWDPDIVISGSEVAEDQPEDWRLEAWLPRRPTRADRAAVAGLFAGEVPDLTVEKLPETDWLTLSQHGVQPIRAGRFHVHTPEHPAAVEPGLRDFVIPASQAFGTGQHATTSGCLTMLTEMRRRGVIVRNCADIGTGTGLLAFAALDLWPRALATASDIDHVCTGVVIDNAGANGVPLGAGSGQLTMLIADGMDHPLLTARGPYDLIIANILAGPLISLAPDFGRHLVPGGHLLLAGLLETQEAQVRSACRAAGLRLAARLVRGDWSILWLRKRTDWRRPRGR